MAAVSDTCHTDLYIGVALPLHHATHEVVFRDQVLGFHQMDSQYSLWTEQGQEMYYSACVCVCVRLSRAPVGLFLPQLQTLGQAWYAVVVSVEVLLTRRSSSLVGFPDPSLSPELKAEETES